VGFVRTSSSLGSATLPYYFVITLKSPEKKERKGEGKKNIPERYDFCRLLSGDSTTDHLLTDRSKTGKKKKKKKKEKEGGGGEGGGSRKVLDLARNRAHDLSPDLLLSLYGREKEKRKGKKGGATEKSLIPTLVLFIGHCKLC